MRLIVPLSACFCLFSCSNVYANNFELKFGGWSDHIKKNDSEKIIRQFIDKDFSYNEDHRGIGLKMQLFSAEDIGQDWNIYTEFWHMKDSHEKTFNAISFGLSRDIIKQWLVFDRVSLSLPMSFVHRSDIEYNDVSAEFISRDMLQFTPYLSFYKWGGNVDFGVYPRDGNTGYSITLFARIGFSF